MRAGISWRKVGFWLLLAGGLAALLVLGFRGLLRDLVADPLVRLWWLIDSLPQGLVWLAVAAVGTMAALRAWAGMPSSPRHRRPTGGGEAVPQLAALALLIRRAEYSGAARRRLAARLARLAVGMRARKEAIPARIAWRELRAGTWPEEVPLRAVLSPKRTVLIRPGEYLDALEKGVSILERRGA